MSGLALRSLIDSDGQLKLYLEDAPTPEPSDGEVVVAIDAAPINPADIGVMFGPADVAAGRAGGTAERPQFLAHVPEAALPGLAGRLGKPTPVGTEGTGLVTAAGAGAQHLIGRRVAVFGGATYARFRLAPAKDCLVMPAGVAAEDAAAAYANPLTALCMLHTLRRDGHQAMVHVPGASALGQMLVRLCNAEGVDIVCIVRSQAQVELLRSQGALHVCDSSAPTFQDDLLDLLAETGATIAFDALGAGTMASRILSAMEAVSVRRQGGYSRYGSTQKKQAYFYGGLAGTRVEINRNFGMAWSVGGWLLMTVFDSLSEAEREAMKARVVRDLRTTFATRFSRRVNLAELLDPQNIAAYYRRATGEKFLVTPQG